jgi:ketosteroid isomerase-like protein
MSHRLWQLAFPALLATACAGPTTGSAVASATTDIQAEGGTAVTSAAQREDESAIKRIYRAYLDAMVDARVDDLNQLLADDFTAVHITGYRQPKEEWFEVIRSGEYDYHSFQIDEQALKITVNGDTAVINGRSIVDATISGMRAPWRLQSEMRLVKRDGKWIIANTQSSTY